MRCTLRRFGTQRGVAVVGVSDIGPCISNVLVSLETTLVATVRGRCVVSWSATLPCSLSSRLSLSTLSLFRLRSCTIGYSEAEKLLSFVRTTSIAYVYEVWTCTELKYLRVASLDAFLYWISMSSVGHSLFQLIYWFTIQPFTLERVNKFPQRWSCQFIFPRGTWEMQA